MAPRQTHILSSLILQENTCKMMRQKWKNNSKSTRTRSQTKRFKDYFVKLPPSINHQQPDKIPVGNNLDRIQQIKCQLDKDFKINDLR